ncbi:hypothetical protein RI543_004972 [Arxiozyma heterogenica]|uniref:Uncharacterized protein n=1 Tax=Arxiozyma heterogenica TaxID=278026 RepID=A0AAN7WFY8_9SACH|nr:hypothetical protein RI543_004972 [Kazachstania heterogenica]
MYDEILGFIYVNIKPFSSTNSKIFNKQTQQLLVTSQQLLLNNLSFNDVVVWCGEVLYLPRSYVIQSFYYAASNVVAHVWLINTLIGSRFIQDLM